MGKIYKPQLRCDAAARLVTRVVHEQLALPRCAGAGERRRPARHAGDGDAARASRLSVPVVEQALAAYLFAAQVTGRVATESRDSATGPDG